MAHAEGVGADVGGGQWRDADVVGAGGFGEEVH